MGIEILPVVPADIPELVLIGQLAFADDAFFKSTFPADITAEQRAEVRQWRAELTALRMARKSARFFKAIDQESQRIVGFSGWNGPDYEPAGERYAGRPAWLTGTDAQAAIFESMRKEVLGTRKDVWFLQSMCVHPEFQGKGIAGQLLAAGLELVDHDDLECYLEATPRGLKVYQRCGFVTKLVVPALDGAYILTAMLRPAKSSLR